LWIGHAGDARNLRAVLDAGILALVDLAAAELPVPVTRDLVYCRFPLVDGPGNPSWLLRLAVDTTAALLRARTPTLVFCGAGMSRSPAIASAAIALVSGRPPETCLEELVASGPCDLASGLWKHIKDVLDH
jgi:hypothetical protein